MSKSTRESSSATRRSARRVVLAMQQTAQPAPPPGERCAIKHEDGSPQNLRPTRQKRASSTVDGNDEKKIKLEDEFGLTGAPSGRCRSNAKASPQRSAPKAEPESAVGTALQTKKLKSYAQFAQQSPFPDFPHPTRDECKRAHRILSALHGPRTRPAEVVAPSARAGCGDSPSVLDALVRTILSQNTSDANSTRAKQSMDRVYGGSDHWDAIVAGGQAQLQEAIKCGGLSAVKSRVIMAILEQAHERYGRYSLDHLHDAPSEAAMTEMLSFQGVGPKTASCVLLFCLRRDSFAVDTHVWRITGLLGWRPPGATRDETHAHLEVMVPDEDKYGLHILLVTHGKRCDECKAGGKNVGKCELRKAFAKTPQRVKVPPTA